MYNHKIKTSTFYIRGKLFKYDARNNNYKRSVEEMNIPFPYAKVNILEARGQAARNINDTGLYCVKILTKI